MRSAKTNRRCISQRARRDAEGEERPPSPQYAEHGTRVGWITFALHGRKVRAELLSTGHHARSYGVRINGEVIGVMGAWEAMAALSKKVPRMMSLRRCL